MFKVAHQEEIPYDLLTLDIEMPGMNGMQLLKKIRDWEARNHTYQADKEAKTLMITVSQEPEVLQEAFARDANGTL